MSRDLKRRIERLEQVRGTADLPWMSIVTMIDVETLGAGERIVYDWLSAENGLLILGERVTTDPNDQGRECTPVLTWGKRYFEPLRAEDISLPISRRIENAQPE